MSNNCLDCNILLLHHAAKRCEKCRLINLKKYQNEYRKKNLRACYERTRISYFKKEQYYKDKRRENYRKKRGIALDDPFRKRKNGEGNIDVQGYKTITCRNHPNQMDSKGRIREHVFIMSNHLGRPLNKKESVHHKNGIRDDNRIENLELWHKGQPAGQRLEDKVKWAIDFLTEYGYNILKK